MSFALTTQQIINETKTVTRRLGWWFLNRLDMIQAVEKCQGLKKGEKVKRLKTLIILSTYPERLNTITAEEVEKEGFKGKSPEWFIEMFCKHNNCLPDTVVNVIRFEYKR